MSIERITLTAEGTSFVADVAAGSEGGPGLVVLHEWWGLNDDIRRLAQRFADEGFVAIAPDLYGGEVPADEARAAELAHATKTERAMEIVQACVDELRRRTGREVGAIGFCLGGSFTFAAAATVRDLACAVPFYGNARKDYMIAERMSCPIQAHFADHDDHISPKPAIAVARDMKARGAHMELYFYDAGHAFMREGDPAAYDADAASLAWTRTLEFLRRELA